LFLIYVNELIDILEKFGVKVKKFAVAAKMYLRITDDIDFAQLQQAVDALINSANMWQLSISVNLFVFYVCFYCTSLGAAVSALCASLSSHTYLCPCNCL